MILISTYQDLLREIEIYEKMLESYEREQYAIHRLLKVPEIDYCRYLELQLALNNKTAIVQSILDDKKETQKEIFEKLNKLEGLEYKIAYKRFIEGKRLYEIADELDYSYDYIKEISSRIYQSHFKPTDNR